MHLFNANRADAVNFELKRVVLCVIDPNLWYLCCQVLFFCRFLFDLIHFNKILRFGSCLFPCTHVCLYIFTVFSHFYQMSKLTSNEAGHKLITKEITHKTN